MGCSASGAVSSKNGQEMNGKSKPSKSQSRVIVKDDPRIPIAGRQVYLLKRSWKAIARNMDETGITMFMSLFEQNESVKNFFSTINKDVTLTELRESGLLESHVRGVMLTIDEAMMSLDEPDFVIDMLMHVGKTHLRFNKFDPEIFWLIREPFLMAVKETLGDRYSAHMADIYHKAICFILTTLISGFKLGQKEKSITSIK
ncbi:non-symbiotic hemoglobin 1-like [Haliotis rubra]|uniref:non-symbiotic hemoglobin 1-like n=1 Tax=Haliotis rubra TaxID=36100 RepID=UPI001EE62EE7|nr:non-symbiotic hemoglobin 1-like [Haliotis rubra]